MINGQILLMKIIIRSFLSNENEWIIKLYDVKKYIDDNGK
jgi:hypothetical protein